MQLGGGEKACKNPSNPPATGHQVRDRATPSHSSPPFPSTKSSSSEEHEDEQQQPVASLPEDALVEILSRVPYRSLRRFKCVSKPWLALCSDPKIRKRCPQTLSGFFHFSRDGLKFHNLPGGGPPIVDPSMPFLRESYIHVQLVQCCSSLLLCQCLKSTPEGGYTYDLVVCNPATKKWAVIPPISLPGREERSLVHVDRINVFLGFDTAAPSRFVLFVPQRSVRAEAAEVAIYSSQTGRWTSVQNEWGDQTIPVGNRECAFVNGTMHMTTLYSWVATVDDEGKVCRKFKLPYVSSSDTFGVPGSTGHSQGRFYAWQINNYSDCELYVWVLEDYDSGKWTLKHTVNVLELFGRHHRLNTESYTMFAIHPERNLIFLTDRKEMTVSYDMDNQKVHVICTSGEFLGGLPYTPCFAD
ncbi:hypothetical protein QYE76_016030 [Lolium multiflorum]|uniref:F-box domain-containing protein n=1 Tax=Lolium multiflorum TaxID=4521 RepID=A0AAD8X6Y5_LOLMU|nr:hypothetical protein QYE76_016030 [Lolium multiflorum]